MDNPILYLWSWVETGAHNFWRNAFGMWEGFNLFRLVRMIAIVGGYFLLRPYLMKFGEYLQGKEHEKEVSTDTTTGPKAKMSPNELRDASGKKVEIPDSDEEEGEAEGTGAEWGKKARKRQRQVTKNILEGEERRRREEQEDEEDKDIREYLVDYVEGEDGW